MFEVICGNIGTVYSGHSESEARAVYAEYVADSKSGYGRASGEQVYLADSEGDPVEEYFPADPSEAFESAVMATVRNFGEKASLHAGSEELGFSWHSCDLCGSHLGGDRHEVVILYPGKAGLLEAETLSGCGDCLFYAANGDLPETWEA
jgi:hypothetical protein